MWVVDRNWSNVLTWECQFIYSPALLGTCLRFAKKRDTLSLVASIVPSVSLDGSQATHPGVHGNGGKGCHGVRKSRIQ